MPDTHQFSINSARQSGPQPEVPCAQARARDVREAAMMGDVDPRAFGGLEATVKHLTERIDDLEKSIDRLEGRIGTLTAILEQARGMRVVMVFLMGVASFSAGLATAIKVFQ
jgi:hypothetical protein